MQIQFTRSQNLTSMKGTALVLAFTEDYFSKLYKTSKNNIILKNAKELYKFKGEKGQNCILPSPMSNFHFVVLFGLGKEKEVNENSAQALGGSVLTYLESKKIKKATVGINCFWDEDDKLHYAKHVGKDTDLSLLSAEMAFGMELKNYRFNKYYTGKKLEAKESKTEKLTILCSNVKKSTEKYEELAIVRDSVFFTRDLVSEPANELNPESYADICRELMSLGVEVEVLGEEKMAELGMGSLLAVGHGSDKESQLVIMKWNGSENKNERPIAFAGKGITFDSGGYSLKPSNAMADMKIDMGGSAVVVGLMKLLAARKAKVNAIGTVALVENMISGKATRPGDVVKSMSGQTIEVLNTDAEGRMILADALYYTQTTYKPKMMIDLATLTGAIMVALGECKAGIFSNNDKLVRELEAVSKSTGEEVWRMPLSPLGGYYDKMIDSSIADMQNIGNTRYGGSITAAQFLQRFIDNQTKWCHIDIAGVAWSGKGESLAKKGATGYGVRLLNKLVEDYYEDK